MALKQYFNIVLVPLKFIPKRTASFWQTIKIPNRFVLKICTGGFADYILRKNVPKENHFFYVGFRIHRLVPRLSLVNISAILCAMKKEKP